MCTLVAKNMFNNFFFLSAAVHNISTLQKTIPSFSLSNQKESSGKKIINGICASIADV